MFQNCNTGNGNKVHGTLRVGSDCSGKIGKVEESGDKSSKGGES